MKYCPKCRKEIKENGYEVAEIFSTMMVTGIW